MGSAAHCLLGIAGHAARGQRVYNRWAGCCSLVHGGGGGGESVEMLMVDMMMTPGCASRTLLVGQAASVKWCSTPGWHHRLSAIYRYVASNTLCLISSIHVFTSVLHTGSKTADK